MKRNMKQWLTDMIAAETKTAARYASIYDEGEITYDKSAPSL